MSIDTSTLDSQIAYAKQLGFGDMHFKIDEKTGLMAIIAINSTQRGPALGGCRFREYDSMAEAFNDALRLANGMSFKTAITDLPLGGGKAVLVKTKAIANREAYFEKFGEFIEELGGRYITAMDSGTSTKDMDVIARKTSYVTSTSEGNGDPSPFTARGVFLALKAAIKFKLNRESFQGLRIAIQGVGHVGYRLAEALYQEGAQLIVSDTNTTAVEQCVTNFKAQAVGLDDIHRIDCDIYSPCALGAVLNSKTIPELKANIIVGAANNQLAENKHGLMLQEKGILYGPDYVVNAGGIIHACSQYYKTDMAKTKEHVERIYHTTLEIFERAASENNATNVIADMIAKEKLEETSTSASFGEVA